MRSRVRAQYLYVFEATIIGLFFFQTFRYLIGMVYSRVSGAAVVASVGMENLTPGLTGVVDPAFVRSELLFLSGSLLLPLLALIFGRLRPLLALAAILAAVMRMMMIANPTLSPVVAVGLTRGAGLLYLAMRIRDIAVSEIGFV